AKTTSRWRSVSRRAVPSTRWSPDSRRGVRAAVNESERLTGRRLMMRANRLRKEATGGGSAVLGDEVGEIADFPTPRAKKHLDETSWQPFDPSAPQAFGYMMASGLSRRAESTVPCSSPPTANLPAAVAEIPASMVDSPNHIAWFSFDFRISHEALEVPGFATCQVADVFRHNSSTASPQRPGAFSSRCVSIHRRI
ncbi:hypothetical protein PSPO01_12853, partial [Paraphaeosphaeria sporulosa]